MKMSDLLKEAETAKDKNKRHSMDLDKLDQEIRKSPAGMDKDTEKHINKKRKDLAMDKIRLNNSTNENQSGSVAVVSGGVGPMMSRSDAYNADGTMKNALDSGKKKSKKRKNK